MPRTIKLVLAFAAVYLIWGTIYLAAKLANETLPPFLQTGLRYLIAGTVLYSYASISQPASSSRTNWRLALLIGVLMILVGSGGVVWALQWVPSGLTAILLATEPLWIVLFSWLWFGKREKPSLRVGLGLLTGFLGIVFLVMAENDSTQGKTSFVGMLVVILCAAAWAVGSVMLAQQGSQASSGRTTATQMLAGGGLLLIAATLAGEWSITHWALISNKSLFAFLFLVAGTLLAFSAYSWLMRSVPIAMASTYAYVNPVIAVVAGWAVAGEHLSAQMLLASGFIVSSVVLIISQTKTTS